MNWIEGLSRDEEVRGWSAVGWGFIGEVGQVGRGGGLGGGGGRLKWCGGKEMVGWCSG